MATPPSLDPAWQASIGLRVLTICPPRVAQPRALLETVRCGSPSARLRYRKTRAGGLELTQMLLNCEVAAGIVGDKLPDLKLKHLIPDAEAVAQKWAERHHGVPINHMVVVRQELSRSRPDVVKDIFRQLHASKRAAGLPDGGELDPYRFGVEACRPILEIIIDFCQQQKLIPRRISVDELFDDTTRALAVG